MSRVVTVWKRNIQMFFLQKQELTAGQLEEADVFVHGEPGELHPLAHHSDCTPEKKEINI